MKTFTKILGGLVLALLLLAAGALALSWAPDRPVEALKARWAPPPSQFVPVLGMQVHVRDEGPRDDPQPIVLLHGTSASLHTWDGWAATLVPTRRVIRMDLPGFGLTGPSAAHDYTQAAYARFVVAVLDTLGVKQPVVLAGNSLGGSVAWKTAADAPQRVARLVLVDSGGYPMQATSVPIGFKLAQYGALRPLLQNVLPRSMIESSVRNVYGDPSRVTTELVDRYYELTLREGNRAALVERFSQFKGGEAIAQIPQIRQPTLILWGGRDRLIPPALGERFEHDIAGSRRIVFPELGHVPQEEDPQRTVAALVDFLKT
ncbi:MAG: alpha/beta hydrolase [Aquabacterium sp.]|jgi:pimeloyl-ACP methyl ester carboxylesterase|nr:MAG: alpha/beta hydrolase [Aquabacterium sp.]